MPLKCKSDIINYFALEIGCKWLDGCYSTGGFKFVTKKTNQKKTDNWKEGEQTRENEKEEEKKEDEEKGVYTSDAFPCPQEGCIRLFQHLSSLERHLSFEKCAKSEERLSLLDLAKTEYAGLLQEGVSCKPTTQSMTALPAKEFVDLQEGWALKESKKSYRFNEKQKSYLEAKFNIGQSSGRKVEPETVAREMRRALDSDGRRLFIPSEFLTVSQVTSFFSRLAAKARHQLLSSEDDILAAEEELNFSTARQDILATIQADHPIVFDQYNICNMVGNNTLQKLKLSMLQVLCEKFELEPPSTGRRRKAPYIALLTELVAGCSCGAGQEN